MNRVDSPRTHLVYACFFLSGAAGLIYQVVWLKALTLVFGSTTHATSTVLCAFMGGLALGSFSLGRWTRSHARQIAIYGWLEAGIGISGLVSLAGLEWARALYRQAAWTWPESALLVGAVRLLAVLLVLMVPTTLMGGTFPVLAHALVAGPSELRDKLSRLYWINTAGAVAGTLATGFFLLPTMGIRISLSSAAALNLLVAAVVLVSPRLRGVRASPPPETGFAIQPRVSPQWLILVGTAGAGALAMTYEIVWTRILAVFLGSSTYAFTIMLATFLFGIALGSWLLDICLPPGWLSLKSFGLLLAALALASALGLAFHGSVPEVLVTLLRLAGESFPRLILSQLATSVLVLLLPATVSGMAFPLAAALYARERSGVSVPVGEVYGANTTGAIVGALATGFLFIPLAGTVKTLLGAAALGLCLSALVLGASKPRRRALVAIELLLAFALVVVARTGRLENPHLQSEGVVAHGGIGRYPPFLSVREVSQTMDVTFFAEGRNASVAVVRREGFVALRVNGKPDASTDDMTTQLLPGYLGGLLHRSPRTVLVIGWGGGGTVRALARLPEVREIDCVEIEPAVFQAAPLIKEVNGEVYRDPRLHMVFDDARNFLFTTRRNYDLIISEPSNPWIAGIANLFTEEFYRECAAHLRPGGMMVQWVQGYQLSPQEMKLILAAYSRVFARVSLWQGGPADYLLVGESQPGPLALDRLAHALETNPLLRDDFRRWFGIRRAEGLLAYYLRSDEELRRMAAGVPPHRDDRPVLEFQAPRYLLRRSASELANWVEHDRRAELPSWILLPDPLAAPREIIETLLATDRASAAAPWLSLLSEGNPPAAEILRWQAAIQDAHGQKRAAEQSFRAALARAPSNAQAICAFGLWLAQNNRAAEAKLLLERCLALSPPQTEALRALAHLEAAEQDWNRALEHLRLVAEGPDARCDDWAEVARYRRLAGLPAAQAALQQALQLDSYCTLAHRELAAWHRAQGNLEAAIGEYEFVLRYEPTVQSADYLRLSELYRQRNEATKARAVLVKARRLFPSDPTIRQAWARVER